MKKFYTKTIPFGIIFLTVVFMISCNNPKKNNTSNTKTIPNPSKIYIENIEVTNKSKDETLKLLKDKYQKENSDKKIIVETEKTSYSLTWSNLKISYDLNKAVNEAYDLIKKVKSNNFNDKKIIKLNLSYDKTILDKFINTISQKVNRKEINASISADTSSKLTIKPETIGLIVDKNTLKKSIIDGIHKSKEENITIPVPTKKIEPKIKKSTLEKINTKISTFSTKLSGSKERINNITIASKTLNGIILMPNQSFSFNNTIGETTSKKGYKEAPVIIDNKLVPSLGGGICQVCTTLYNSILRADIPSVERYNHSMPSTYVKIGLDATVFYNDIDYKFKNTLKYPIYIQSYIKNNVLTFNVYSNSSLNKKKYDFDSKVYKIIPNNTKTIYDNKLPKGKKLVEIKGSKGYKVSVYKITYENKKQISKKLIYKDFYKPVDRLVRIGK